MDVYHIWCNLKPGTRGPDFVASARAYFEHLRTAVTAPAPATASLIANSWGHAAARSRACRRAVFR